MFTRVQREILRELKARGGEVRSLGRLANDLNLEYSNARSKLIELQQMGIVIIDNQGIGRGTGRALVIKLVATDLVKLA